MKCLRRSWRSAQNGAVYFLQCGGRRFFLRLSATLSLLLCIFTTAVWLRSYWVEDSCVWTSNKFLSPEERERSFEFGVCRGLVLFEGCKFNVDKSLAEPFSGWVTWHPASRYGGFQRSSGLHRYGFAATRWNFRQAATGGSEMPDEAYRIVFPLWLPTILFACGPGRWLVSARRRVRSANRTRQRLCVQCGYDLRASELRCPECGNAIVADIPHKVQLGWHGELASLIWASILISTVVGSAYFWERRESQRHHHAWLLHERIRHFFEPNASRHPELIQMLPLDDRSLPSLIFEMGIRDPVGACDEMVDAIQHGRPDIASQLLEAGADVNARGSRALSDALREFNLLLAIRLIDKGADVRKKDQWGKTPLNTFIETTRNTIDDHWRDTSVIPTMLLARGADPNEVDDNGATPLHLIASGQGDGAIALATLLLAHGANVNAQQSNGYTPLKLATREEMKELLRSQGAKK